MQIETKYLSRMRQHDCSFLGRQGQTYEYHRHTRMAVRVAISHWLWLVILISFHQFTLQLVFLCDFMISASLSRYNSFKTTISKLLKAVKCIEAFKGQTCSWKVHKLTAWQNFVARVLVVVTWFGRFNSKVSMTFCSSKCLASRMDKKFWVKLVLSRDKL